MSDSGESSFCICMYFGMKNKKSFCISVRYVIRTYVNWGINMTRLICLHLHILHVLNTHQYLTSVPCHGREFTATRTQARNSVGGSRPSSNLPTSPAGPLLCLRLFSHNFHSLKHIRQYNKTQPLPTLKTALYIMN
jgi:hypothetical protein